MATVISIKELGRLLDALEEINGGVYAYEDIKELIQTYRLRYGLADQE